MTTLSDALQIALSLGFFGCLLITVALFQAGRLVGLLFDAARLVVRYIVPVWRPRVLVGLSLCSLLLWALSGPLSGLLEEMEYLVLSPTVISGPVADADAVAVYERVIRSKCSEYEANVTIRRTGEIAALINSTPRAIYETCILECGLDPFEVRKDKVAAGWIQFTNVGLKGLGATLSEVIAACERRDIVRIMDLTERYLVRKWEQAGRPDMRNTIDLYLAVFAPAHIGGEADKVVYAGFGKRAYDLNSGLDGWYLEGDKIVRKRGAVDGKITVWEIYLCLERKKSLILNGKIK